MKTNPSSHSLSRTVLILLLAWAAGGVLPSARAEEPRPNGMANAGAPSAPGGAIPNVWFSPNMGSADYLELFTNPEEWSGTRPKIGVIKFYTQNLMNNPCVICGKNTMKSFVEVDAFRKLAKWGVAIAVEVPSVKPWGCGLKEANVVTHMMQDVEANGGEVAYLAMDEPLVGGALAGANGAAGCGFDRDHAVAATAQFVKDVKAKYPRVRVGDIEPYSKFSVEELGQWIDALRTAGFNPAFFHLDVDRKKVAVDHKNLAHDLKWLGEFCARRGIPFGVIFWSPAKSDQEFYESTMKWVQTVNAAMGRPAEVIFQNWDGGPSSPHDIPANTAAHDPTYNHMRVIEDSLAVFGH